MINLQLLQPSLYGNCCHKYRCSKSCNSDRWTDQEPWQLHMLWLKYKNLPVTTCFWSPTSPLSFKFSVRNCFGTPTLGEGFDCSLENKSSLLTKHQTLCQVSHQIGILCFMSHPISWDHSALKGGLHNNFVAGSVPYAKSVILTDHIDGLTSWSEPNHSSKGKMLGPAGWLLLF